MMLAVKKVFKLLFILLCLYISICVIMSICWYRNYGSYSGRRYGITVIEIFSTTISDEYIGTKIVGLNYEEEFMWTYDSKKFTTGDKVLSILALSPFDDHDDAEWFCLDFKIE